VFVTLDEIPVQAIACRASKIYFIMERVETLLKKLQDQFTQQADAGQLLLTVQMLQAELLHLQKSGNAGYGNITVTISQSAPPAAISDITEASVTATPVTVTPQEPEKIVEVLQVNEEEIEAELEEIRRNAEALQKISAQNKPQLVFEEEKEIEIPTLAHQPQPERKSSQDINETASASAASLNDKLKQTKIDLGDSLLETPIRDLKKAIGINDRFLYINELFRGDEAAYERSIKTINSFSILPEAEYWIQRELKVKNGWVDTNEVVKQFYLLVKRRFS